MEDKSGQRETPFFSEGTQLSSEFWYIIMYAIGSYAIETIKLNSKIKVQCESYKTFLQDRTTKIFCGYWILYTIATYFESTEHDNI